MRPGYGGMRPGPMGGPWCCWPFLCVLIFVIVCSVGISLIQSLMNCSTEYDGRGDGNYTVRGVFRSACI